MTVNIVLLIITTLIFYAIGGTIDYWQSARHHNKKIPSFLDRYFALFWLLLYSGVIPLLLIFFASNFNIDLTKKYFGAVLIGAVIWDLVYAIFDQNKLIAGIEDYWFWNRKDYGLTKIQILVWHLVRFSIGLFLIFS